MLKVAVFGASFNPPTRGHEDVVNQALEHFDEVLLIPSVAHAFGKNHIPLHYRLEMLRLFVEPWQKQVPPKPVKIFNIETLIQAMNPQKIKVYTYDVLSALDDFYRPLQRDYSLYFILGPDNAAPHVWSTFYRYQDIETRWNIFVAKENIPIRSTAVRALLSDPSFPQESLYNALIQMVSVPLANYILQHQLYRIKE